MTLRAHVTEHVQTWSSGLPPLTFARGGGGQGNGASTCCILLPRQSEILIPGAGVLLRDVW